MGGCIVSDIKCFHLGLAKRNMEGSYKFGKDPRNFVKGNTILFNSSYEYLRGGCRSGGFPGVFCSFNLGGFYRANCQPLSILRKTIQKPPVSLRDRGSSSSSPLTEPKSLRQTEVSMCHKFRRSWWTIEQYGNASNRKYYDCNEISRLSTN